jgi:hypothetical protein
MSAPKYPKLWDGPNPVGEARLRGLEMLDAPYLTVSGPGFSAHKRGGFREVYGAPEAPPGKPWKPYKGLAYAAWTGPTTSLTTLSAYTYTYPYESTPNEYGTAISATWSASSSPVDGETVKQSVARLVARDPETDAYADTRRGIVEGTYIQPETAQPYWVREARKTATETVFEDTDEVHTTGGYLVFSNNKVLATYVVTPDVGYRELVFPFAHRLIALARSGYVGRMNRLNNPKLPADSIRVVVEQHETVWHLDASANTTVGLMVPLNAPDYVMPAVNQSGDRFALASGGGWLEEYSLRRDTLTGEVEGTLEQAIDDGFAAFSIAWTATEGSASITPALTADTSSWLPSATLDAYAEDADHNLVLAPYVTLGAISTDAHSYRKTWVLDDSETRTQTVGAAYANDVLVPLTLTCAMSRSGTVVTQEVGTLYAQGGHTYHPLPPGTLYWSSGNPYVPSIAEATSTALTAGETSPMLVTYPGYVDATGSALAYRVVNTSNPGPQAQHYAAQKDTDGIVYRETHTLTWQGGSLVIWDHVRTLTLHARYDRADTRAVTSTGPGLLSYGVGFATTQVSGSCTLHFEVSRTSRTPLLIDPHNGVLAYLETIETDTYDVTSTSATDAQRCVQGSLDPQEWIQFFSVPATHAKTVSTKCVLQFAGSTLEQGADSSASETVLENSAESDWSFVLGPWFKDEERTRAPLTDQRIPTMQGMCPYMAYRHPADAEKREMLFAYTWDTTMADGAVTTLQLAATERGIEDWLSTCGVPAAAVRVAGCFRVGGPRLR